MVGTSSSIISSNSSFPYSVTSINSRKSRKNVLYPRRVHPPPVTVLPESVGSPDMLAWEVRYLCATLLPHSETRLLPAGIVLLKSLGQARDLSAQRKNEETRHCSELFIVLTREVLLKDAIGVEELEGPCKLLHLTFRDILFKSGAFDTPKTSILPLNVTGLQVPHAENHGPERFTGVLRALRSVTDVFEAALNMINTPAVSDAALHHRVSLGYSVVKDLTMDQYRRVLGQKLARAQPLQSQPVTHTIPSSDHRESISVAARVLARVRAKYDISEAREADTEEQGIEEAKWGAPQTITTIEEGSEAEDEGNSANPNRQSCNNLIVGKRASLPRRLLCRFPPLLWVFVKKKDKK